jgi:hypothetical protein
MYISVTKYGFITIIRDPQCERVWILQGQLVLDCLSERKSDDLGFFHASWNWERSSITTKGKFNRVFFIKNVLADFDEELWRKRPMKRSRDTFLHLDNATPHWAPQDFDRLGIARLLHPPDSLDLALCDFWLFGTLEKKLERSAFGDQIEVLPAVNTIFQHDSS